MRRGRWSPSPLVVAGLLAVAVFLWAAAIQPLGEMARVDRAWPTLTVGTTKQFETTLTPASPWHSTAIMSAAVHRGLLIEGSEGALVAALAQEVPSLANGGIALLAMDHGPAQLVVRARLRPDLKWSDGRPLTSRDVRFTYELLWRFTHTDHAALEQIERIETPTDSDVVIRFVPGAIVSLGSLLQQPIYALHAIEGLDPAELQASAYARTPIGSGPFVVKEWRYVGTPRPGRGIVAVGAEELHPAVQSITLEPNPFFSGIRASVRLHLKVIPADRELAAALRAGEIDLVTEDSFNPGSELVSQLAAEGFHVDRAPGARYDRLDFNVRSPRLTDPRVRRAIAAAIDREAIALELLGNDGRAMTSWLPTSNWVLLRGSFDLALFPWRTGSEPDLLGMWHTRMIPTPENGWRGNNFPGWSDPSNDAILERTASLLSRSERLGHLVRQQEVFAAALPSLPLFEYDNVTVRSASVGGFAVPTGTAPSTWRAEFWTRDRDVGR